MSGGGKGIPSGRETTLHAEVWLAYSQRAPAVHDVALKAASCDDVLAVPPGPCACGRPGNGLVALVQARLDDLQAQVDRYHLD